MSGAEELRRLHYGRILVLPNVWDVASAALVASVPGCRALATTSSGVAASLGYPDGERIPAAEMLAAVARIAAAADLPVSADLEAGYGDPVGTARAAVDAGLAGLNLEDQADPPEEHVERIKAIRAAHEALADGTYGWLEGAVSHPELSRKLEASATIDAAPRGGAVR